MLQNIIPFFIPFFKSIVWFSSPNWVCHFFLKTNYNFIVLVNGAHTNIKFKEMLKFNKFVLKTYSMHWFRVSFRGKGFRLRKFKALNKVTLNFGHSHWAKILLNSNFFFKKIRRQNYLCLTTHFHFYKSLKSGLKFFKKLNTYTKRGLRLRKQYIRKRFGKISQVVSSLH